MCSIGATLSHHQITPLDSLVTHLGASVFRHSGVVKLGGSSVWLQLQSSSRSSSHIPAFKWNKQDGWLLTEGHQPWAQRVCMCACLWANYEEKPVEEVVHVTEEKERVANYKPVYVTEITDTLHVYAQDVETGPSYEYIWTPHNQNRALAAANEARQLAAERIRLMQKESHRCCLGLDFSVMVFPITETVICCKRLQTAGKGRMERGGQLESLMETMRAEIAAQPPVEGSYAARRGDYCIAKFADGEWYRARVEKVESPAKVHVFYIDYGNREVVSSTRLAAIPPAFSTRTLPAQATEYAFGFIQVPTDCLLAFEDTATLFFALSAGECKDDARADVVDCVVRDIQNSQCLLNVEYSGATCPHVTIQFGDTKDDVGLGLVKEGLVMVDVRKEKYLQKMPCCREQSQYNSEGDSDTRTHIVPPLCFPAGANRNGVNEGSGTGYVELLRIRRQSSSVFSCTQIGCCVTMTVKDEGDPEEGPPPDRSTKRLTVTEYLNSQESAKSARLNIWRYGDFRADDADEFGYRR
ncbi:hypothetical protein PAMA_013278 [Pampus argenteus]